MFYGEGTALNTFVSPDRCTQLTLNVKGTPQGIYDQISVVTLTPQTVWRVRAGWQYKKTAARSTSTEPHWSLSAAPHWEPPGAAPVNPARSVSLHTWFLASVCNIDHFYAETLQGFSTDGLPNGPNRHRGPKCQGSPSTCKISLK